jgi:hypothetical protein
MSRYITDEDLEAFVRDVLQEEPRRKETALRLSDAIARHKAYEERARCDCGRGQCRCLIPMDLDGRRIQAGDAFTQITPDGREFHLGALGVRTLPEGRLEIFTAGWPAMTVCVPEHGRVELLRKGEGITKWELRHRRESVGGTWDDGL